MRIVVMSDSHGDWSAVQKVLQQNPGADGFLHLGDGYRDWVFQHPEPHQFLLGVCGNNDWGCTAPTMLLREFDRVPILAVHGHTFGVKNGLYRLTEAAKREHVQLALFGHTHRPCTEQTEGIWLINPGSLGDRDPVYCILEIVGGRIRNTAHRRLMD